MSKIFLEMHPPTSPVGGGVGDFLQGICGQICHLGAIYRHLTRKTSFNFLKFCGGNREFFLGKIRQIFPILVGIFAGLEILEIPIFVGALELLNKAWPSCSTKFPPEIPLSWALGKF